MLIHSVSSCAFMKPWPLLTDQLLPLLSSAAFSATMTTKWTDSEEAGGQERVGGERSLPKVQGGFEGVGGAVQAC